MNTENKFTLPAEWFPQDAVQLTWPHKNTDWWPILDLVEPSFVEIAKQVCHVAKLILVVNSPQHKQHVLALLQNQGIALSQIIFVEALSNDTWARDHGPISLVTKKSDVIHLDFTFNGWGQKYPSTLDNAITQQVARTLNILPNTRNLPFVLEGGAIECDGKGTLLTTTACVFNANRNPTFKQDEIIQQLKDTLGVNRVLLLTCDALAGDDTDAHIDTLCRFAPNDALVYVSCDDKTDEHFENLKQMENEIKRFTTITNEPYTLFPLPMPSAKYAEEGERLPATYANYLITNGVVLVPTYRDKHDKLALNVIEKAYPEHKIIGVDCLKIIEQHGSLHCLTMQFPKGTINHDA